MGKDAPFQQRRTMIPLNKTPFIGTEYDYIKRAVQNANISGGAEFTQSCQTWIEDLMGNGCKVLLTPSCTRALELAAILINIQPGDEVILPSFTYVSSVNAFVLLGATPVMIDIEAGTMNMDPTKLEAAITPKTKAIVPVHYAGYACDMDRIMDLADRHNLKVIEDAAHAPTARYKGRALGSIGHFGCFSFHETKNFTAGGQGGAIVINDLSFAARAEIVFESGTNRRAFWRGEVTSSYGWMDIGSNFTMSEIQAAYLWSQFEIGQKITERRLQIWEKYDSELRPLAEMGYDVEVPPANHADYQHNAHMYFIKLRDLQHRNDFQRHMKEAGITCSPHYMPLHHRPIFKSMGRYVGVDRHTTVESERLIRLPLYTALTADEQLTVIAEVKRFLKVGPKAGRSLTNGTTTI